MMLQPSRLLALVWLSSHRDWMEDNQPKMIPKRKKEEKGKGNKNKRKKE